MSDPRIELRAWTARTMAGIGAAALLLSGPSAACAGIYCGGADDDQLIGFRCVRP